MKDQEIQNIIEAALLSSKTPLTISKLKQLFSPEDGIQSDVIKQHIGKIQDEWGSKGLELREISTGWRFQTRQNIQEYLNKLTSEKPPKYSRAVLETLAIIVWKQPVTRGDIENIRGVVVSSHIIKTLEDRQWIEVVGYKDAPGKPALFATTQHFLNDLGLKSLEELPELSHIEEALQTHITNTLSN